MLMALASPVDLRHVSIFGRSQLPEMKLAQILTSVRVPTQKDPHPLLPYPRTLDRTISVKRAPLLQLEMVSFMAMIHSGMDLGVALEAAAALARILHISVSILE